jgi:hypothetical protein
LLESNVIFYPFIFFFIVIIDNYNSSGAEQEEKSEGSQIKRNILKRVKL